MFQRLYELGSTVATMDSREEVHELLRDPIADDYRNLIEIVFSEDESTFQAVDGTRINPNQKNSILYKKGPPNGCDVTAVSMFAEDPAKTVNRVKKAVIAIAEELESGTNDKLKARFDAAAATFEREQDAITAEVKSSIAMLGLSIESRGLLSVAFKKNGSSVPVWGLPEVAEYLIEKSMAGYGKCDKEGDCQSEDAICSVCCKKKKKLYGNFNELKTYNLDKPGNIAGGFSVEQTVRNFPVCPECAGRLALGINTAETRLAYKMAGQSYLILPQCASSELRQEFMEITELSGKRESLHGNEIARLTEDEEEILDLVADKFATNDQVSLKFVFYDKDQQSWKIRAEIDQVLPSRIREIFAAKTAVEKRAWRSDKEFVSMSIVREFSGGSFTNSRREFLSHVDAVFAGKKLDEKMILRNVVDQILIAFKRDEKKAGYTIRRGLMLIDFYQQLKILPEQNGVPMNTKLGEKSAYGQFLDANPEFFGNVEKRVAFLTGALVRCVMNAQYDRLKNSPFSKKLKGMRVNSKMLRKLLADCKEKLRAYDAEYYPNNQVLMELLCEQWVTCGDTFKLSADETTFCFTVGLTLNYHVTQEFGKQGDEPDK